jgi:hypothetical protein
MDVDEEAVRLVLRRQELPDRRSQRLVVARHDQHRRRLPAVLRGPDDDVSQQRPDRAWPAGARKAGEHGFERERDPVAALMVHRALVDWNDPLRFQRVMAHHRIREHERYLVAETGFRRRRNQRWNVHAEQPRKLAALVRELLGIGHARQCAAAAHAEVFAMHLRADAT